MGNHRRDQSDSHIPLRQNDYHQSAYDKHELQIRMDSPGLFNGLSGSTGGIGQDALMDQTSGRPMEDVESGYNGKQNRRISVYECTRSEIGKTVVAFLCMMLSAFLNFFLLTVIHDIVPREPLPDLVFMAIPQQHWAWSVGDVLSTFSTFVSFVCIMLHKHRLVILRRVLLLGAIMYGLRAVVMGVTFLPPSFHNRDEICVPQVNRTAMYTMEIATRFVTYVVTMGLTSGQDKILCGDLMFSGHTVVFSTMYFVQLQYTPRRFAPLRVLMTPITYLGIAALVVSGGHYTMDVLIAYWLTSHVFWTYHQIFEMPRGLRAKAPLSRLWWFWVCYWFESDVPDKRLPNEYNWPLSRPRWMVNALESLSDALQ